VTLGNVIDLSPLGAVSDRNQLREGLYASGDEWDLSEPADLDRLAVQALSEMARRWGILDIERTLAAALQAH
jgi:hypothetical protein